MKKTKDKVTTKSKKTGILVCMIVVIIGITATLAFLFLRNNDNEPDLPRVYLTYANMNMAGGNYLEVRMLQSFMDEHPHIVVTVDHSISLPWMIGISTAAAENRLPDVFSVDDLGTMVANGWLADLTSHAWGDLDFFDLPRIIQEAVLINGYVYALPAAQDIQGYFVNNDLFRSLGLVPPAFGVSVDDFLNSVSSATDLSHPSIGLNQSLSFADWYPGAVDPALGFFGFDGRSFQLDSPEMHEAIRLAALLHSSGYTFSSIADEDVRDYFPIGYNLGAFRYGQIAMFYGGSWLMDTMLNQIAFDWDFIGVPGGRSVVTLDIIGVSANTNHPEEAYLLARWMGHGVEGNMRRLQYANEMGITLNTLPITQNPQVLDILLESISAPGLRDVYDSMERALVDGARVLPGYMQARHSAPTGVSIPGTVHTNATVNSLITYSILEHVYFPNYSSVARDVSDMQLEAAREILAR